MVIEATSGHMYGFAPLSWDLPDGEQIKIDVDRAGITSGLGLYHAEFAFTATLGGEQLRCESEPSGPDVPMTRFGCWSMGESKDVTFWLAPDEVCPARHVSHVSTLTTPGCWNGKLTMNGERASLHHGYLEATGSPVGYVSWTTEANELLLAANIVTGLQVRVYEPTRELPEQLKRRLLLLTVALSWWEHAARSD